MMAEIYGGAERVCIWLGDATVSSQTALAFIKNEVLQLQNFDGLCESEQASSKWGALLDLMQRPWFSRRWVVQEIALAKAAIIYCGRDKISWNKFAIAVELFVEVETATHRLSEVMKKDPKYYHVPGKTIDKVIHKKLSNLVEGWFEYVSALGASLLVDATGRLFRDYKEKDGNGDSVRQIPEDAREHDGYDSSEDLSGDDYNSDTTLNSENSAIVSRRPGQRTKGSPLLSLEYLISSLSIFDVTNEHDTIYALLAIAKDTVPVAARKETEILLTKTQRGLESYTQKKRYEVDYDKPYVDVCKDFIQFCVERSHYQDPTRALDVICRPWATEKPQSENARYYRWRWSGWDKGNTKSWQPNQRTRWTIEATEIPL
jgi:hypothetical protein